VPPDNITRTPGAPPAAGEKPKLALSTSQIVAAGLATATITVLSSFAGVAGTLIGAAVASMASTAATALYSYWVKLSGHRLRTLHQRRLQLSPLWLVAGAAALFALALATVTAVEAASGRPVSALVRGGHQTGTTLGHVFAPAPSASPAVPASPSASPSRTHASRRPSASPSPSGRATPARTASPSAPASPTLQVPPVPSAPAAGSSSPAPGYPTGSPAPSPSPDGTPAVTMQP
jgi:hypothetical protein